ncbi:MAG TPA: corrinoid protein [Anaerolineaceae bacterium]|jgi:5-methyltetrahydrofolate--homocysteine methyltransferase
MSLMVQNLFNCILDGQDDEVASVVQAVLDSGVEPSVILNDGMIAAMAEVGQRFENGDYFLPEMLAAGETMQAGLAVLKPHLVGGGVASTGKVVIGSVKGDVHDIGKNLVGMMMEGAGFEVEDLGTDVSPEKFVKAVQASHPNIVALSALLLVTMPSMKATIDALAAAGVRNSVKVMVGGAPVTEAFAQSIGADCFAPDASRAVTMAKALVSK